MPRLGFLSPLLPAVMPDYKNFFDEKAIINALCKQRMSLCSKTHEKEFFQQFLPSYRKEVDPILNLMPPRSRWKRPSKKKREKADSRQQIKYLYWTVQSLRESSANEDIDWINKQDGLIDSIRTKALIQGQLFISPPAIKPFPKDNSKSGYRIIASYSDNLVDSILIGQCAKYLRRMFDDYFFPCSFAFRYPSNRDTPVITHHDAFAKLVEFWQKHKNQSIFVAESDIQGFYDTISHEVILDCYDQAIKELSQKGIQIDEQARHVIVAYLESYTYKYAREQVLLKNSDIPENKVKNRYETLKVFSDQYGDYKYGVPQGGALSVFFANLILHKADQAVQDIIGYGDEIAYVRYCDDMVIATLSEDLTTKALTAYNQTLFKLRLAYHEPDASIKPYAGKEKRNFWRNKTKNTYLWSNNKTEPWAMPWLAFVGYQLRYDGMVRVRPSSLKKEIEKQRKTRKHFLKGIDEALKHNKKLNSKRGLLTSLEARLRASAIGKRPAGDLSTGMDKSEFGWCAGFIKLSLPELQPQIAQTQLRYLDRGLGKQLGISKERLNRLENQKRLSTFETNNQKKRGSKKPEPKFCRLKFFGKPRSYAGQLNEINANNG